MKIQEEIYIPYFNSTEKEIIYSSLEEAAGYLCKFYSFSPREWFNHCYDLKTEQETIIENSDKNAFAEVGKYTPVLKDLSIFPKERYQICLFDRNILKVLWRQSELEFYPFMVYLLTHELIHIARFCQNFHPFDCDETALQKEEQKVKNLTQQVLNTKKNETFYKISSLYNKINPVPCPFSKSIHS